MPHPDAVLPCERARALSFNTYTSRPDHWNLSIFVARTVNDTYIEQARRADDSVVRSEEFTLTPALLADLEAQQRLRASISSQSSASTNGTRSGVGEEGKEKGGAFEATFAAINAWRYDPRAHGAQGPGVPKE